MCWCPVCLFDFCPQIGQSNTLNWTALVERVQRQNGGGDKSSDELNFGNWNNLSERISSGSSSDGSSIMQVFYKKEKKMGFKKNLISTFCLTRVHTFFWKIKDDFNQN